jgi:O-antigen ligase
MTREDRAYRGRDRSRQSDTPPSTPRQATGLPQVLWIPLMLAPVLGWFLALSALWAAVMALFKHDVRNAAVQALQGPSRWIPIIALCWWVSLLTSEIVSQQPAAWWTALRFLLIILPACALISVFNGAGVTHEQIGRWARLSVWVTTGVIALEYVATVHGAGLVHHRPRALSGNALFVATMLVPMMMLSWLDPLPQVRHAWAWRWATHAAGVFCLSALLGARSSTLVAVVLTPLPVLWLRRGRWTVSQWVALAGCAALVASLALVGAKTSAWYGERWDALLTLLTGADLSSVTDYGISTRAQHWPAAWHAFLEQPWLGYGFLQEHAVLVQHLPAGAPVLPTAHQQFLSFLLWAGLPGLLTGSLFIALPVLMAWRNGRGRVALYAATTLSLPLMLHGLTDTLLDDLRIVSFHLMMTVLLNAAVHPSVET